MATVKVLVRTQIALNFLPEDFGAFLHVGPRAALPALNVIAWPLGERVSDETNTIVPVRRLPETLFLGVPAIRVIFAQISQAHAL